MSAIGGCWNFAGADAQDRCRTILAAQHIYAPDVPATWSGGGVTIGRRLFKTLPEDVYDRGPQHDAAGRWSVVADARLDNRDELTRELGISGPEAARLADSTVLHRALERWNEEAVDRLVGDFAFAAWDSHGRRLLLARDFLGQRPLHYHVGSGFFAFSSMAKGLLALPEVPSGANEEQVTEFLALIQASDSATFFKSIQRALPGHLSIVTASGIEQRRYWRPSRTLLRLRDPREYAEAVRSRFDQAVASRLRGSEGRVGSHMSGGLDSSAVAATAARLISPGSVTAFTAVPRQGYSERLPRGRLGDEGPLAESVAALHPNMEHVLIRSGHRSPFESLDRNFFLYERPVLNLCNNVWSDAILDAARSRRLKVLLTGQMGNLSFSYTGMQLLPELLARGKLLKLLKEGFHLWRGGTHPESLASHAIGPFMPAWMWRTINRWRGRRYDLGDYSALNPERRDELEAKAAAAGSDLSYRPRRDPFETRLWAIGRTDLGNFNKGQLGGWGIDVRDPTADRRLVELCLSIPASEYLRKGETRAIARRAFSDRLPASVVNETRKGLQAVDWHEGFVAARDEASLEVQRISMAPGAADAIDLNGMRALLDEMPRRDWHADPIGRRYRLALLRAVSTGHFLRKASGSNG